MLFSSAIELRLANLRTLSISALQRGHLMFTGELKFRRCGLFLRAGLNPLVLPTELCKIFAKEIVA